MTITFDRNICCDLNETISREWLVTNGLGGYAAGTVAGVLTRMQHGLLVATSPDTVTPQLLLAKIDEEVTFDQRIYYLGTNEYQDGTLNPAGFVHLETFTLDNGFPVFTYRLGGIDGIVLEKRIWMPRGYHTTYIQYRVLYSPLGQNSSTKRGKYTNSWGRLKAGQEQQSFPCLNITLLPLVTSRPYNSVYRTSTNQHFQVHMLGEMGTPAWPPHLPPGIIGCTVQAGRDVKPYHIAIVDASEKHATFLPTGVWYWNFLHRHDSETGQQCTDDLYLPGVIRASLSPEDTTPLTVIVSAEQLAPHLYEYEHIAHLYKENIEQRQQTVQNVVGHLLKAQSSAHIKNEEPASKPISDASAEALVSSLNGHLDYLSTLINAKEHFLVHYPSHHPPFDRLSGQRQAYARYNSFLDQPACSIRLLAEYYTQEHRTREALIAFPGFYLVSRQFDEARCFLREINCYFSNGLLPDRLPTHEQPLTESDYNNVDIALWYFYALDHYLMATRNYALLAEVFPSLQECIQCYRQGTHNGILVDEEDGLLYAHKPGRALTWMNAYHEDKPVTQRAGKAVEVNALWYHALLLMHEWSRLLFDAGYRISSDQCYRDEAERCQRSFQQRFWCAERRYLYDVIDGPDGNDASLRVNQLFALSLRYAIIDTEHRQHILEVITHYLLTPYGLRTLAPIEAHYQGQFSAEKDDPVIQTTALHQGSIWAWLIGPFIDAALAQCKEPERFHDKRLFQEYLWRQGLRLLEPFQTRINVALLGMCEGNFAGDYPHQAGPQLASLLSIAEILRCYDHLIQVRTAYPEHVLSY